MPNQQIASNAIYQGVVRMSGHSPCVNGPLIKGKPLSLIENNAGIFLTGRMKEIGKRIGQRLKETGKTQADLARYLEFSNQRVGNYVNGTRPIDARTLARTATFLSCSSDYLLGISEDRQIDAKAVIHRLLELDGMPGHRAETIAEVSAAALRLLASFPNEGDASTRAHLAAQAAWQNRQPPQAPN